MDVFIALALGSPTPSASASLHRICPLGRSKSPRVFCRITRSRSPIFRSPTHSADVDYAELLPSLFELDAGNFYVALAGEKDRTRVLKIIRQHLKPEQWVFIGVVAPIDPRIETPEEIRDRILEAVRYIPLEQLGTTDDCGFSPFSDDTSTSRETAFAKIRARVEGTALASEAIGDR